MLSSTNITLTSSLPNYLAPPLFWLKSDDTKSYLTLYWTLPTSPSRVAVLSWISFDRSGVGISSVHDIQMQLVLPIPPSHPGITNFPATQTPWTFHSNRLRHLTLFCLPSVKFFFFFFLERLPFFWTVAIPAYTNLECVQFEFCFCFFIGPSVVSARVFIQLLQIMWRMTNFFWWRKTVTRRRCCG